jgi:hypothetical protein
LLTCRAAFASSREFKSPLWWSAGTIAIGPKVSNAAKLVASRKQMDIGAFLGL